VHGQVDEIQGKPFGSLAVFARGARRSSTRRSRNARRRCARAKSRVDLRRLAHVQ
jgi:hypothetical protein